MGKTQHLDGLAEVRKLGRVSPIGDGGANPLGSSLQNNNHIMDWDNEG